MSESPGSTASAPASFAERVRRAPFGGDLERGREVADLLEASGSARDLVIGAAGGAPFLARLARRDASWAKTLWACAPEDALAALLGEADRDWETEAELRQSLRIARRRVALLTALADLGGVWSLEEVTGALTGFADAACRAAVRFLLREEAARGDIPTLDPERSGYVLIAMGKMGAGELNYSSDIDLIALFDQDRFPASAIGSAKTRFARLTQRFCRILSDVDADGYVARVDLRLRPDLGSTLACVAMEAAERYYEAMGRTWERAAHIKARAVAGDVEAGQAYLKRLRPFVWRRHLDFAALQDAADMLSRIRAHQGGAELAVAGQDVKLGAGGIREIEFIAQTQQLILGGRDPGLRTPKTLDALDALAARGRISAADRDALNQAYRGLRGLEHRLQMVEDQQTHRVPSAPEGLERISGLSGAPDVARFEAETRVWMSAVRRIAAPQLDAPAPAAAPALAEAAALLPEPGRAEEIAERWFSGRLRAVRSPRARDSLERLAPRILRAMASAPDPMRALVQFDRFLSGLPAGVQLLASFEANPGLLDLLTEICAAAPRLADLLASRPGLLDAVLDGDFYARPPQLQALIAELEAALEIERQRTDADYERLLDAARRWARERRFQVGVGVLRGAIPTTEAGAIFSDLAEACVRALWPIAIAETTTRHGPPPGRGAAVVALGKLGSREMTATSDLDLIVVYDADLGAQSEGPRPLAAPQYYARLTQTLTNALAAPTSEGALYEVDMRLRPSGRAGPLATALEAFRRYQREDAWIWEHMALTRARVVAGPQPLREAVRGAIAEALAKLRDPEAVRRAALEMRAKLAAAHPTAAGRIWALKHGTGGMVDLEFIAQSGLLTAGVAGVGGASTIEAFERLGASGALPGERAAALADAYRLQLGLHQVERVALDRPVDQGGAPEALRHVLAGVGGLEDFPALEAQLTEARAGARAAFERWFAEAG